MRWRETFATLHHLQDVETSGACRLCQPPSPDAAHPFILLLRGGGGDPVDCVVALHHSAVGLRLAGLDHLVFVVRDEELKAVLGTEPKRTIFIQNNLFTM